MNTKMIALLLIAEMQSKHITYDELRDITSIPKSSLQRYMTGEREIPLDRFKPICDALGLNACEVLGWGSESSTADETDKQVMTVISRMSPHTKALALEVLKRFANE